jgi:glycosyltransferase involved in cell wall biosynthesis
MKLLVLTNNPDRPSFRQRIEVYLDILQRNGIKCEVARLPAGTVARCRLLKRSADFDAVFLHKKRLNLIEAVLLRRYSRKTIYDFDDAVMYKTVDPQRKTLCGSMRFRLTVKLADLVIAGNPYLAEHARKFNTKVEVLPTGLNTNEYEIAAARKDDGKVRLVWIGSRSTLRYLTEITPALEEIGSRYENVILRMVCNDFIGLDKMSVEKCLWSEQTQAADLVTSDIGLAPLPDNRFTRGKCGFKVLQYASAGLPVVASPVGVNCGYVQDNVTGYLASDTEEWVDRMSRLVENAQLRKNMGQSARKSVKRFDVSVIGEQLAALILQCASDVRT